MCQIIVKEYQNNKEKLLDDLKNFDKFEKLLSIKGGRFKGDEGYSIFFIGQGFTNGLKSTTYFTKFAISFSKLKELFFERLKYSNILDSTDFVLAFFSRQRPEMEKNNIHITSISPYTNNNKMYFVHGTISNDEVLAKKYEEKIHIDTEVFKFISKKDRNKNLDGLYSYIEIDRDTLKVKMIDRGMGKYIGVHDDVKTYSTTNIFSRYGRNLAMVPKRKDLDNKSNSLKIAFSGGMDSVLNTYKILSDLEKKLKKCYNYNIWTDLIYFEYSCNAEKEEINASKKFINYILKNNLFKGLDINFYRENISGIINNVSSVTGEQSKLLNSEAKGNEAEAESTLAYVPFRNTLMTQLLVSQSQKEFDYCEDSSNNYSIMVGLGLNLSDGQVYGDNNIAWLEHTENMLKYGGKRFSNVKLLSPYINRTKINMLKEFKDEFGEKVLNDLLDISFSCYYPEDGKACGKCGSCLLRQEAIKEKECVKK